MPNTEKSSQLIRNIAVIAHVDHGKTTLIDAILKQTHTFRDNEQEMTKEQIMDSNDLEQERGITILAKNCSVEYKNYTINIIDTPGHADFSGEVERTLSMADGALLIIDAQEGPMPQTRFVLKKALELNLKIIVVINKTDKQFAQVEEVKRKTDDLFLELAANEDQLNFPILYAVARQGVVSQTFPIESTATHSIEPLLDTIISYIPLPGHSATGGFKMVVSALDYDNHLGRIAIGKVQQGTLNISQKIKISQNPNKSYTATKIFKQKGLKRIESPSAFAGEIISVAGISDVKIGETLTSPEEMSPLPTIAISEPTLHMYIGPNTSPFSGLEGEFTTSPQIEQRLKRELETNLSLRLSLLGNGKFQISGRGELHLAIVLETLRREGYELEVGKPEVIVKEIDGIKQEPYEEIHIIVPTEHTGIINQELGKRSAELIKMEPLNEREMSFMYNMPTRTLIGLRSILLTLTRGTVVLNSQIIGYRKVGPKLPKLRAGVLIADTTGDVLSYGLFNAQQRGSTFVSPGTRVYEGMIIGQSFNDQDLAINVCKGKQLTNMRSSGADDILHITPPIILSLEQSLDFLEDDELLEITPQALRLRKKHLTDIERRRARRSVKSES
jgi:GTP-binding protein